MASLKALAGYLGQRPKRDLALAVPVGSEQAAAGGSPMVKRGLCLLSMSKQRGSTAK